MRFMESKVNVLVMEERIGPQKWSFCDVCKRNHEQGRKHIFSNHHKAKLAKILTKFSKKVHSARRCLGHPRVLDGELEPGGAGKMWCYCCHKEVSKHITDGQVSVEWGGLLEHMAESEHHKLTRRFWWMHGADSDQIQTYLLYSAEYSHFKELALAALTKLEAEKRKSLEQLADDLRAEEEHHTLIALESPGVESPGVGEQTTAIKHTPVAKRDQRHVSWAGGADRRPGGADRRTGGADRRAGGADRRTGGADRREVNLVPSSSRNLTAITPKQVLGVMGNVHTGAMPPWLRDDGEDGKSSQIGPSLDQFILHKERQKRAGKNPKRVGADFHINLATRKQPDSDDWLPAFGRVWNHGPRFHSKGEFLQEVSTQQLNTASATKSTTPPSVTPSSATMSLTAFVPPQTLNHSPLHTLNSPQAPDCTSKISQSLYTAFVPPQTLDHSPLHTLNSPQSHDSSSQEVASHDLLEVDAPPHTLDSPGNQRSFSQPSANPDVMYTGVTGVKPYSRKRVWDADLQRFIVKQT